MFGIGGGQTPEIPGFTAVRTEEREMQVEIKGENAVGYNILWGSSPEKLYHSWMTFGNSQKIPALVTGREYYVRVDAFNENGITEGNTVRLK